MRCKACNVALDDKESVRKDSDTGDYLDLCNTCYYSIYDETDEDFLDELVRNYGELE